MLTIEIDDYMKRLVVALLPFLCLLCVTSCGASAGGDGDKDEYWYAYDGNLFEEIVKPEAEAWRQVAKVIYPYVRDDDYARRDSYLADSLCDVLISRPYLSYGEQLVRLYEIQTYVIYGMSFVDAYNSRDPGDWCWSRGSTILLRSKKIFQEEINGYYSPKEIVKLHYKSVFWFLNCFYSVLYGDESGAEQWLNRRFSYPSELLFSNLSKTQAFRWSERLGNADFYCSYLDLMRSFIKDEDVRTKWAEKFSGGKDLHIAYWLDSQCDIVLDKVYGEKIKSLPSISLAEHTAYMKRAAGYRVHMIETFAEALGTFAPAVHGPDPMDSKKSSRPGAGSCKQALSRGLPGRVESQESFKTGMGDSIATNSSVGELSGSINGHEYVDLGLSVKWATCNVGAVSPSGYGDHYAWGETMTKKTYTSDNCTTYGWGNLSDISGNAQYDVASALWGGTWRIPTYWEIKELNEKCDWSRVKFGFKVTGPNGNSIFLPFAGLRDEKGTLCSGGKVGFYWSSTPMSTPGAYYLGLDDAFHITSGDGSYDDFFWYSLCYNRSYGCSVRPVSD